MRPFRVTSTKHLDSLTQHLLRLNINDRYLRFCSALSDDAINGYTSRLNLAGPDVVFVVTDADPSVVVGMLHIAPDGSDSAEFALSVDSTHRKRGIGDVLFERGLLHCESVGIRHIYMNCLSTNEAIKRMAAKRGMKITTDRSESMATLDVSDVKAIAAWLKAIKQDTVALYDLNCKYTKIQWDNYVAELRKLVQ